jgi:alpha,alpha-trehalose-phosphate synthase [UDP-forming]
LVVLQDHRLVVVSNRAPVEIKRRPDGNRIVPTVGGMVSALLAVFKTSRAGLWVAWSGSESSTPAAAARKLELPADDPCFTLRFVRLTERDVSQYYYGFSNRGLWPLSHYFVGRCQFRAEQWQAYRRVNETFASTLLEELSDHDFVWVQDFHLTLVPAFTRRARPDVKVGFFWHIPFPEPSVFGIMPWRDEVLRGLLGSDVIGFHLESYARNFLACVERFLGLEVDWIHGSVTYRDREVRAVACPIGIDADGFESVASRPDIVERSARIRRQLGGARVILGVDRLDYTKGILERLRGFERFLETSPASRGNVTFVQIAVPSRERVEEYRVMKRDIEEAVGRISGKFTREGWVPLRYIYGSVSSSELGAYYGAADVALVTPLRDGMNLVAKEYVASRFNDDGVLILSEFAGAAEDMPEAVLVNPYNVDDVAARIESALRMPAAESRARMRKLRARVRERDLRWWLRSFLGEFWRSTALSERNETAPAREQVDTRA